MNHIEQGIYDNSLEIENRANKSLSNITSTSSPNFDGQWVESNFVIAYQATSPAVNNTEYDLSSYLPNDNYDYEVLVNGQAFSGTTSGSFCTLEVNNGTSTIYVCEAQTRTTNDNKTMGSAIIPIGTSRKIYVVAASGNAGKYNLAAAAYRRIGTNV